MQVDASPPRPNEQDARCFTPIHFVANGDVVVEGFKLDDLGFHAGEL